MKILMLSLSSDFFRENSDTLERHKKYAQWLRRDDPTASLTILALAPKNWPEDKILTYEVNIHAVPCARWRFYFAVKKIIKMLVAGGEWFDLITTQTPFDDGLVGAWAKKKYGLKLNVQMHSSFLDFSNWLKMRPLTRRLLNAIGKRVARRADTIRVVSLGEQQRLEEKFIELKGKIYCLPLTVGLDVFRKFEKDSSSMTKVGTQNDVFKPYFLYVGRLVREKNLPFLLRSFAKLLTYEVNSKLVIVGEGPLRRELELLAEKLGIGDRLVWTGRQTAAELRAWYAGAVATILPSFYEGFGRVIAESSLMGTPCVVTPVVSAPELIKNGETGFILSSFNDTRELADKLSYLLSNQDTAKRMGEAAKKHISDYLLSEDDYADKLIYIWRKTLKIF